MSLEPDREDNRANGPEEALETLAPRVATFEAANAELERMLGVTEGERQRLATALDGDAPSSATSDKIHRVVRRDEGMRLLTDASAKCELNTEPPAGGSVSSRELGAVSYQPLVENWPPLPPSPRFPIAANHPAGQVSLLGTTCSPKSNPRSGSPGPMRPRPSRPPRARVSRQTMSSA